MITIDKITTFTFLLTISWAAHASPEICRSELKELVIPPLEHVSMNKKDIQADIADVSNGVYSVRLYVAADSPDNLDKQVSIGWVNLDTNSMKVLDVTRNIERPDELKVNEEKYRTFISNCLHKPSKEASKCDDLNFRASQNAIRIPHDESKMTVIGNGRLQFYSAPDLSCKMPGIFILNGESVEADKIDHEFTSISYLRSQKSGPVLGWVRSNRLKRDSVGAAPPQPANGEQIK